jgi:pilus assembly protein CpaB
MEGYMRKIKVLALISAVLVAVLLYNYLNTMSKQTITEISKIGVIVAAVDIDPNIPITADMIKSVEFPDESIHGQSIKDINEVIGKVSTSEIIAGEQVLSSKLVVPGVGNGTLAYKIKPNMRAITIGVSNTTGLSNMIIPDNRVDIIGQYEVEVDVAGATEKKTIDYTTMLLENVRVLAVGNDLSDADKEASEEEYVTLTLEVTPLQAMEVNMSEYKGALRAILRSPLDEGTTSLPALTIDKVIFKIK